MTTVFADAYYFIALLNPADAAHARAMSYTNGFTGQMVTTSSVLTELADAFSRPGPRHIAGRFLEDLPTKKAMRIVWSDDELFRAGLTLYQARAADKDWSLTDCISFVVMAREGMAEALTGDRHFEQAGFVALLK